MSNSLWPYGPQHARPPCLSPTPGVYPNSCPLSWWCHPTISSSVVPFSSCLQSFPESGSFQMSQLFASGAQSIGVSASTSILPLNTQDWSPLGWTCWTSLQSKGLLKRSLVFSILLFSSISLQWPLRKAFLSFLAILWNSALKWEYLSFSPLLFASLLFTAICKTSSDNHFAFLHFFFLGMVLIPVSCTMSWTSIQSSSGILSDPVP